MNRFVDHRGNEFTEPEAIQDLMRRVTSLETRNDELSDLINVLIGRIGLLERQLED